MAIFTTPRLLRGPRMVPTEPVEPNERHFGASRLRNLVLFNSGNPFDYVAQNHPILIQTGPRPGVGGSQIGPSWYFANSATVVTSSILSSTTPLTYLVVIRYDSGALVPALQSEGGVGGANGFELTVANSYRNPEVAIFYGGDQTVGSLCVDGEIVSSGSVTTVPGKFYNIAVNITSGKNPGQQLYIGNFTGETTGLIGYVALVAAIEQLPDAGLAEITSEPFAMLQPVVRRTWWDILQSTGILLQTDVTGIFKTTTAAKAVPVLSSVTQSNFYFNTKTSATASLQTQLQGAFLSTSLFSSRSRPQNASTTSSSVSFALSTKSAFSSLTSASVTTTTSLQAAIRLASSAIANFNVTSAFYEPGPAKHALIASGSTTNAQVTFSLQTAVSIASAIASRFTIASALQTGATITLSASANFDSASQLATTGPKAQISASASVFATSTTKITTSASVRPSVRITASAASRLSTVAVLSTSASSGFSMQVYLAAAKPAVYVFTRAANRSISIMSAPRTVRVASASRMIRTRAHG